GKRQRAATLLLFAHFEVPSKNLAVEDQPRVVAAAYSGKRLCQLRIALGDLLALTRADPHPSWLCRISTVHLRPPAVIFVFQKRFAVLPVVVSSRFREPLHRLLGRVDRR